MFRGFQINGIYIFRPGKWKEAWRLFLFELKEVQLFHQIVIIAGGNSNVMSYFPFQTMQLLELVLAWNGFVSTNRLKVL